MPLTVSELSNSLANQWLVPQGGQFPGNALESGDRFAGAVTAWFANALAGAFPCTTALVRRPQLAAQAAAALEVGLGPTVGQLLALAVGAYMAGHAFGLGVSAFPVALSAGMGIFTAALTNLAMPNQARADQIAAGCHAMALSVIVTFPPPTPPAPVV